MDDRTTDQQTDQRTEEKGRLLWTPLSKHKVQNLETN